VCKLELCLNLESNWNLKIGNRKKGKHFPAFGPNATSSDHLPCFSRSAHYFPRAPLADPLTSGPARPTSVASRALVTESLARGSDLSGPSSPQSSLARCVHDGSAWLARMAGPSLPCGPSVVGCCRADPVLALFLPHGSETGAVTTAREHRRFLRESVATARAARDKASDSFFTHIYPSETPLSKP
jgi:hypothetical protein